jgi:putative ABC transport system ATP-binding protein
MSEVLVGREPVSEAVKPPLIELAGVEKVYRTGKVEFPALCGVDLSIDGGEMVAIVGPSGSGKSTIMNMITGIDRPSAGTVTVDGRRIDQMSEEELAIWRGQRVGVVFQFFQAELLPRPFELLVAELARPRHAREAEVRRLREDRRVQQARHVARATAVRIAASGGR